MTGVQTCALPILPFGHLGCMPALHASPLTLISGLSSYLLRKPLRLYDHHVNSVTILSICYHLDILGVFQLSTPDTSPLLQTSAPPSCQNHYGIMITMLSIRSPFCRSVTIWTSWVYSSSSRQPLHPHFRPQFFPPAKIITAL